MVETNDTHEAVAESGHRRSVPDTFVNTYRGGLTHLGLSVPRFAETYPLPIRLRPTRWLEWGWTRLGDPGDRVG